ncbi:MAG TPA: hypothetical protein VLK65_05775 [Vicinamibacteria bacterium]|nr:hypothetical protein [Vicinamibacteria bacterium]
MKRRLFFAFFALLTSGTGRAESEDCKVLCAPALKLEPTVTISNLFGGAAIADSNGGHSDSAVREEREAAFEIILSLGIPTEIPRVGVTLETIWKPFATTDANPFTGKTAQELGVKSIRDNSVELEIELNLSILEPEHTGGWVDMHFDVVDQLSPAARPNDEGVYTHKLDFELDTAVLVFHRLPEAGWLRNVEVELSLDYLATGIPKAGDVFPDGTRYLEDASPWSLSFVFVLPIAPLFP